MAGTERGITEPKATFSPCFGGPFLPQHPLRYAELLKGKIEQHQSKVYLVNTGWVGASASSGAKRIKLPLTRVIIHAILDGSIENSDFDTAPYFHMKIPKSLGEIDNSILNPLQAWTNESEYHSVARELVKKFQENYNKYDLGDPEVLQAGPTI